MPINYGIETMIQNYREIYQMDAKLSKLFYHTIFYLTDDDKINFLRYII